MNRRGPNRAASLPKLDENSTIVIHSEGSSPPPNQTDAGGTPGYMAPEVLQGTWDLVDHRAQAGVDRLDRLDHGRDHAGVADHIGIREVDDDEVVRALADCLHQAVADAIGAHLGLEIVGGDLFRRLD